MSAGFTPASSGWMRTVGMADAAPNIEMRMAAGAVTRAVMVFSPVDSIVTPPLCARVLEPLQRKAIGTSSEWHFFFLGAPAVLMP